VENKKFDHAEKGQSLVELALTLLIILTLLAGAVDLGMAFFSYVALRDAAQEGALYGSLSPSDTTGISDRIRGSSSTPVNLADPSKVTINPTCTCIPNHTLNDCTPSGFCTDPKACRGETITVTVLYNYPLSMPIIGPILGSTTIPITARVTDTILNPACTP